MNPSTEAEALWANADPRDKLIVSLCKQIERLQLQVITLGSGTLPKDTP